MSDYRVLPGPLFTPARLALARRFSRIEDAVRAMGEGIVVDNTARLVAFHERHLPMIERLTTR